MHLTTSMHDASSLVGFCTICACAGSAMHTNNKYTVCNTVMYVTYMHCTHTYTYIHTYIQTCVHINNMPACMFTHMHIYLTDVYGRAHTLAHVITHFSQGRVGSGRNILAGASVSNVSPFSKAVTSHAASTISHGCRPWAA